MLRKGRVYVCWSVMFFVCRGGGPMRELSFAERVGIISSVGVEKGGS